MKGFFSVRTKILLQLVAVIVVGMGVLSYFVSQQASNVIERQSETALQNRLDAIAGIVDKNMVAHVRLPESLAQAVKNDYKELPLEQYRSLSENLLAINPDTFGVGIFFEPGAYDAKEKYFSTYAYRDGDKVVTTEEYSAPAYDYPSQDWYRIAVGQTSVRFTTPYYDPGTGITMMTAAVPVFDPAGRFIAVATADLNVDTVQRQIESVKVGMHGYALLLAGDGTYLAGPNPEKIMKAKLQDDPDPGIAEMARKMIARKQGELHYRSKQGNGIVSFQSLPGTDWIVAAALPSKEISQDSRSIVRFVLLIGAAIALAVAAYIWLFSRGLSRHILRVNEMAERLASGDFTHRLPVKSRDEFGKMAENLNRTNDGLRVLLSQTSEKARLVSEYADVLAVSAEQTGQAAEEVAGAIQKVAEGSESQMHGAAQSSRALDELSVGVQRIAESASELFETSRRTSDKADQGNELIGAAVEAIGGVNDAVLQAVRTMEKLRAGSEQIGGIIEVIEQISRQTNLLSLNAGIEAARAGEHGKGFGVVAMEIRKLAEATSRSAAQVRELIEDIQRQTSEASEAVLGGAERFESGIGLVGRARENFCEIAFDVRNTTSRIEDISASSEQIAASSEEVTASVTDLSQVAAQANDHSQSVAASSEEQLAAMQEIRASTEQMKAAMRELSGLLGRFRT